MIFGVRGQNDLEYSIHHQLLWENLRAPIESNVPDRLHEWFDKKVFGIQPGINLQLS